MAQSKFFGEESVSKRLINTSVGVLVDFHYSLLAFQHSGGRGWSRAATRALEVSALLNLGLRPRIPDGLDCSEITRPANP